MHLRCAPQQVQVSVIGNRNRSHDQHGCPITGHYPWRCLCLGFVQITRTTPWRLMILQFSQRRLTDGLTFMSTFLLKRAARCHAEGRRSIPFLARQATLDYNFVSTSASPLLMAMVCSK